MRRLLIVEARDVAALGLDRRWRLADQVAIRPESFGALAYHYGNRRLSFLKDRTLVAVVAELDGSRTGRQACEVAGVAADEQPRYGRALSSLAASAMLVPSDQGGDAHSQPEAPEPPSEGP